MDSWILDLMGIFNWQSLIFVLPGLLAYSWPSAKERSIGSTELLLQKAHNHTAWTMFLWQEQSCLSDAYSLLWLKQLRGSQCPFIELLMYCLIALPVYNLLLLLIGWHLNRSASKTAERMLLVLKPVEHRLTTVTPLVTVPPLPPPRGKRRSAPKPPTRRPAKPVEKYPSQKNPFSTAEQNDQYKTLRRNLIRVLEGLQQPISQLPLPLPMPMPVAKPLLVLPEPEAPTAAVEPTTKNKKKSRTLLQSLVKRLSKPFAKSSRKQHLQVGSEANNGSSTTNNTTTNNNTNGINNNINVIQLGWQRLRHRASRRTKFYVPSASSSETISSSSCIYAY